MASGAFDPSDPDFQYLAVDRKKMLREQTQPFDGKKMCWVPDEKEGFVGAEIQSSKGEEITVKTIEKQEVGVAKGCGSGRLSVPLYCLHVHVAMYMYVILKRSLEFLYIYITHATI